ncbi:MAG TPA: glycosyltransferase family 2 protein [Nitrospirae bacterium]|nr:glycosyltransferase family 2 protein [Nitrospirota bacterium]
MAQTVLGKKIVVVMPAFNAEKTLEKTYRDLPHEYLHDVVLVDDASNDKTVSLARELGIRTIVHEENRGYGGNQKTCYGDALDAGADIVVMVHPDYQYSPRLVTAMSAMIASGEFDVVLGSRIITGSAIKGGMPRYKYIANRFLTFFQNMMLGVKLSEYHTGFRAFSREVIESLPLEDNSDDFVFDNQMLSQAVYYGFRVGELSCPTRYFADASSINFMRSVKYGLGVLWTSALFRLGKWGIAEPRIFPPTNK